MESDSVRTSGEDTLVDVWIDGKMRSISVSREAIATFLQLPRDRAAALTDDDRREYVRTHLGQVIGAAKDRLRDTDPGATLVRIEAGPESTTVGDGNGDRRRGERRRGERRKTNLGPQPPGDRRR